MTPLDETAMQGLFTQSRDQRDYGGEIYVR